MRDSIQLQKSVHQFDRVAVLRLMISSLGGRHVVDHPVGGLTSKCEVDAGFLFEFPGKRGSDPFDTSGGTFRLREPLRMGDATSVTSSAELVKDAVSSVIGSGSGPETSLIKFHDHAAKIRWLTAISAMTGSEPSS